MKTLDFYSVKGGTGKSSISFLSAMFLSSIGKKTLILDLDPQRSLSKSFGKSRETLDSYSWLMGDSSLEESIQMVGDNLYLLPGSLKLLKIQESVNQNFIQEELSKLNGFDYVLLDNQPTWNSIVRSGIQASDKVLIPSLLSFFDLEEVGFVIQESRKIKKSLELNVILNRILNAEKPSKEEIEYLTAFQESLGANLLKTRIPNSSLVRKFIDRGETLEGKSPTKQKFSQSIKTFLEEVTGEGFQPLLLSEMKK